MAINTFFSKLKAAMVSPRIAPPVPRRPAENPDKPPPIMAFRLTGFMINFFLIRKRSARITRNNPRNNSSYVLLNTFVSNPPITTNRMDGIPIFISNLLSSPFLNKTILLKLLER